jgi:hypothetical protein
LIDPRYLNINPPRGLVVVLAFQSLYSVGYVAVGDPGFNPAASIGAAYPHILRFRIGGDSIERSTSADWLAINASPATSH